MIEATAVETLYAEATLGKDAEEFLASDIGRYVLARAEEEEQAALAALSRVSSFRRRRILELQAQVWRAQQFKGWLGELIVTGRQALQQLEAADE
jgi:hypothetical protein